MIAAMNNEVATGRRMNGRDGLIRGLSADRGVGRGAGQAPRHWGRLPRRLRQTHAGALREPIAALRDDLLAGRETARYGDSVFGCGAERDRPRRGSLIVADDVHVVTLWSVPDRGGGHRDGVVNHVDLQLHVHELIWKQRAVVVAEARLGTDGAGLRVDQIVESQKRPLPEHVRARAIEYGRRQRGAGAQALLDLHDAVGRQRKYDIDGCRWVSVAMPVVLVADT